MSCNRGGWFLSNYCFTPKYINNDIIRHKLFKISQKTSWLGNSLTYFYHIHLWTNFDKGTGSQHLCQSWLTFLWTIFVLFFLIDALSWNFFIFFSLLNEVNRGNQSCQMFFRILALCHTVMPDYSNSKYYLSI